ncbi:hypothetical protein HPB51_006295 [Rhipicephalus microplus]|uniref:Uncharacterized protein n=1 Tax=Rhipicephalus microplus TaxID=6941 RepID=A0A9J6ELZ4_RHIMP|nr:hypothetical protein HPB51_006295 [Rhipicephalus microplus]
MAAPENTSKGLIRGVSNEESPEDILSNLITPSNPGVLHAKRMGNADNIIVLFEGVGVPRYVRYEQCSLSVRSTGNTSMSAAVVGDLDIERTCVPIPTKRCAGDVEGRIQRKITVVKCNASYVAKINTLKTRDVRQDRRYHTRLGDVTGNGRHETRRKHGQRALRPATSARKSA